MLAHLKGYLIVGILLLFLAPIMSDAPSTRARVIMESRGLATSMGVDYANDIITRANGWFADAMKITNLSSALQHMHVDDASQRQSSDIWMGGLVRNTSAKTNSYLASAAILIYQVCIRLSVMLSWIPFVIPFTFGVIVHALAYRKVKMSEFRSTSPQLYMVSAHMIVMIAGLPILYLLAPFSLPVLFMPIWALAGSVPLMWAIQNLQRMIIE